MKQIQISIFGDSIGTGQRISAHQTWVCQVSQKLMSDLFDSVPGYEKCLEVSVINDSVNGNTTRDALDRMPFTIQNQSYDIVYMQFGLNDSNYWPNNYGCPRVSKEAFKLNLFEMVFRCIDNGVQDILLATNHPTNKGLVQKVSYESSVRDYNEIIREVVYKEGLQLVDVESSLLMHVAKTGLSSKEFVLPDGVHLNVKGHQFYRDFVCGELQKSVKRVLGSL